MRWADLSISMDVSGLCLIAPRDVSIRRIEDADIFDAMFIHRFHWPYYLQVPVYVWPILFFNLWRVDRWSAATGKRAFVVPDVFGIAWVPYHESMEIRYFVHNLGETRCPEPYVEIGCLDPESEHPTNLFSADASASWGPGTALTRCSQRSVLPSRHVCDDAFGPSVWCDPGWRVKAPRSSDNCTDHKGSA
ncbi:MAG: hypothetical protein AAF437_16520 [Pseudomonadota bacterium]